MTYYYKRSIYYLLIAIIFVTAGCKAYQPVVTPVLKNVPDSFAIQTTDTTSIADVQWRSFFADSLLVALIDTALLNNPDLQIAMQRIEAAKAILQRAKGAFLPSVNAVATTGIDKFGNYTMNGVGNFDTNFSENIDKDRTIPYPVMPDFFLGLRSNWEIDLWGKLKNSKKAAASRLLASEKGRQFIITSLVADIASGYYNLLALDNQLQIIQRNIKYQQDALEIVKVMKETGRATQLAVQQFQAQLYNTQSFEYSTKQQIVQVQNSMNYLLGRYPQTIQRDSNALNKALPQMVNAGIPATLLTRRPDVQQASLELEATKFDVAAAKAASLPSLTITPYLGLNAFKAGLLVNTGSVAYGILGGLTAPLLNKKEIYANYKLAGANQQEAFYRFQQSLINSFTEVHTGLNDIENKRHMQQLKSKEVEELRSGVSSANDLYVAGYASYLEVITAQKSVLQAEFELNDTRKDVYVALIQLYRALGGGWQ